VITLGLGLGNNRTLPTARTAAAATPSSSPPASPDTIPKDERVPATFPTEQRLPFQPPVELQSANGQLQTEFSVEPTTFSVAGAQVKGYAFQGQYIGPTLRVRPGDTVRIDLTNRLGQPTNLHGHGMFMSPLGISDNVLRVMKSDTFNKIVWKLPTDIEPGTYWYHTHLHGLVEKQVFSGLSGVLIVDGLDELLPPICRVNRYVVALEGSAGEERRNRHYQYRLRCPPTTRTVNGQVDRYTVRTNETQMLPTGEHRCRHLVSAQAERHTIPGDRAPSRGRCGPDELDAPAWLRVTTFWSAGLTLVPHAGDSAVSTRAGRDNYPPESADDGQRGGRPGSELPGPPPWHRHRRWRRTGRPPGVCVQREHKTNQFYINEAVRRDASASSPSSAQLRWTLKNVSREGIRSIHVNDFLVMAVNGKPVESYSEQATVPLPVGGEVQIRMHFNRFVGTYVFHCHILAHEDNGMMNIVDVSKDGKLSKATQQILDKMNREMAGQHMGHH
jgi:FtsP/CotA-like multicopper oxidase with cupredoxin domain